MFAAVELAAFVSGAAVGGGGEQPPHFPTFSNRQHIPCRLTPGGGGGMRSDRLRQSPGRRVNWVLDQEWNKARCTLRVSLVKLSRLCSMKSRLTSSIPSEFPGLHVGFRQVRLLLAFAKLSGDLRCRLRVAADRS